jgi:hypothetical protein
MSCEKLKKAEALLNEIKLWANGQNLASDDQCLDAIYKLVKKYQQESEASE